MPIQINLECHNRPRCKFKQKPGWQLFFLTKTEYLVSNCCTLCFSSWQRLLGYAGTYFQARGSSELFCLDHNRSLGSQNKICQVILAEGQTGWSEFLPDTMHLTSVESQSDSSLFSTFKHKIWSGLKTRTEKALLLLSSWYYVRSCLDRTRIGHNPFDQIWWPCVDRTGGLT